MSIILVTVVLLFLLAVEIAYRPIARRKGWTTRLNMRRDGHPVTVIGGGIIFYIGMVLWSLGMGYIYDIEAPGAYFLIGLTMLAGTSFADDILRLPVWVRLVVQFVAVMFLCFEFSVFAFPVWITAVYLVGAVGFVNGYNFMDGINGMTAAYSTVTLGSLLYINQEIIPFTSGSLIIIALGSAVIFGFFNFRRYALAFAGDVGSISMGFIIAMLLTKLMIHDCNIYCLVIVAVYSVDIFATIVRRIIEGENIFQAHRKHIYERMYFVWRKPQLAISSVYALLQLAVNAGYLMMPDIRAQKIYFYCTFATLIILYLLIMAATERKIRRKKAITR